jgi:hypothetical protein
MRRSASAVFLAAGLLSCAAGLLLAALRYQLPDTRWGAVAQDWGHVPLFGLVTALLLGFLSLARSGRGAPRARVHLAAFGGAVALGALIELAQHFQPGRTASFGDFARDVLGAGLVIGIAASFDPGLRSRRWWRSRARRWALRATALATLVAVSSPLLSVAWAYAERHRAFPQLLSFESGWEQRFLTLQTAELVSVPPPPGHPSAPAGERVGRLTFSPEAARAEYYTGYSGFFINEPYPDWRGFQTLRLSVLSESAEPLALTLQVEDEAHHGKDAPWDVFRRNLLLERGWNEFRIPLASVASAPRDRRMDMARIRIVHLYVYSPATSRRVYLDDLRLE